MTRTTAPAAAPPLSTKAERAEYGKAVRQQVPLQAHAAPGATAMTLALQS